MRSFSSFLSKKDRDNKEHLHILQQILEKAGFQVANYLDDPNEPYVFVSKPIDVDPIVEGLSFGGIRLYTRGKDIICYRAQNKQETEPYGNSRQVDINGMFKDLVRESDKQAVGHRIIFYIIRELRDFFIQSAKAEKEDETGAEEGSQMGSVTIHGSMGTDYANNVTGNGTNYGGAGGS